MGTTVEKLTKVLETKEAIRTAINNKGGTLTETDTFASYPNAIDSLPSGGGNTLKTLLDATKSTSRLFYNYKGASVNELISYDDTSSVTTMQEMFNGCSNITTIPQLDMSNVTNMSTMFKDCESLTEVPLINTNKVTDMQYMFMYCKSLNTIPLIDTSNVTKFDYFLAYCNNLKVIPNINTSKGTSFKNTFINCSLLERIGEIDTSKAKYMTDMFSGCTSLEYIAPLNTDSIMDYDYSMIRTFYNCNVLSKIDITTLSRENGSIAYNCYSLKQFIIRKNTNVVSLTSSAFTNCYHFYGTQNDTYNPNGLKDGRIYVPDNLLDNFKTATNWSVFADIIKPLCLIDKNVSDIQVENELSSGNTTSAVIYLDNFTNIPEVSITTNNESVATISDIVITNEKITFNVNALNRGLTTITAQITGDISETKTINIKVYDAMSYTVEKVDGAYFGFALNDDGFYESELKTASLTYALCKLTFNVTENTKKSLILDCILTSSYNNLGAFGILSDLDKTLTKSYKQDTYNVYKSIDYSNKDKLIRVTYPDATIGEHSIYLKYTVDRASDITGSLQFKVIS